MKYHKPKGTTDIILSIILTLCVFTAFSQSGNNVVIDEFSDAQSIIISTTLNTPTGSTLAAASVLGGERDLSVTLLDGTNALAEVAAGTFNLSVGSNSTGTASIVYDGADGDSEAIDFNGLAGLDMTNGGTEDRYKISVISADHPGSFVIEVYTDADNSSSATMAFDASMDPKDFNIFFSDFTTATGSGADFKNVGAIVITANGDPEIDLRIDRICTEGPPPTCKLTSVVGSSPECIEFTDYSVTVTWAGIDESVTISAGGSGVPASVTADAAGSATFTYPLSESSYNITFSDSDGLCGDIGSNLSGDAPGCAPPPCGIAVSATRTCAKESDGYTVTVTWTGVDERVTISAGGSGTPASVVADDAGTVTFQYPFSELNYNITISDSDGVCTLGPVSGTAQVCNTGIPTMGEWGLICLAFIFLIFGTKAIRQYVFSPSMK